MVLGIVFGSFVLFALAILWNPANILALAITVYSFEQYAQANSTFFGAHASLINICFGVLTLWALICVTLRGGGLGSSISMFSVARGPSPATLQKIFGSIVAFTGRDFVTNSLVIFGA